jgi:activator of 2-hydroxyglutaryl-CoA dehydratase
MESDLVHHRQQELREDLVAGLCYSIVQYLNKVIGKAIGKRYFPGGTALTKVW